MILVKVAYCCCFFLLLFVSFSFGRLFVRCCFFFFFFVLLFLIHFISLWLPSSAIALCRVVVQYYTPMNWIFAVHRSNNSKSLLLLLPFCTIQFVCYCCIWRLLVSRARDHENFRILHLLCCANEAKGVRERERDKDKNKKKTFRI